MYWLECQLLVLSTLGPITEDDMRQQLLKQYLQKAAEPDCTLGMREEILRRLREAAMQNRDVEEVLDREEWSTEYVKELFDALVSNSPELLPGLFPAFALLCGDRDGSPFAQIEWSAISDEEDELTCQVLTG